MQTLSSKEKWGKVGILMLTAVIWGFSFPAQSAAGQSIPPFTVNAIRYFIGGTFLLPLILYRKTKPSRDLLFAGILCGICVFVASSLQQIGLQYTSAGKAGFITTFYIVLVPIFSLLLGKKNSAHIWLACLVGLLGLYFLSSTEGLNFNQGDLLILACSFFFTGQILTIDHYAPRVDNIAMASLQFYTVSVISLIPMLLFEEPSLSGIETGMLPLVYLGIMSSGIGYTLQIVGQRGINPTIASLIFSTESVFSVIGGYLILGEILTQRELLGCVLMFIAVILAQLPPLPLRKKQKTEPKPD